MLRRAWFLSDSFFSYFLSFFSVLRASATWMGHEQCVPVDIRRKKIAVKGKQKHRQAPAAAAAASVWIFALRACPFLPWMMPTGAGFVLHLPRSQEQACCCCCWWWWCCLATSCRPSSCRSFDGRGSWSIGIFGSNSRWWWGLSVCSPDRRLCPSTFRLLISLEWKFVTFTSRLLVCIMLFSALFH